MKQLLLAWRDAHQATSSLKHAKQRQRQRCTWYEQ